MKWSRKGALHQGQHRSGEGSHAEELGGVAIIHLCNFEKDFYQTLN